MVFCSLFFANFSSIWVGGLGFLSFIFGFHKRRPSTFSSLNIWSNLVVHMWIKDLPVPSTSFLFFPLQAFFFFLFNYEPLLIYIYIYIYIFLFLLWTVMTLRISQNGSYFKTQPPLHLFHSLLDGWPVASLHAGINDLGI